MEQLFDAILEIAGKNPDGFTVDLTTLKKVTKGISVAYLETQDSFLSSPSILVIWWTNPFSSAFWKISSASSLVM